MADKKISQLTAATTPLAGTEVLPIVQGGSTVKVSAADITAGRSISASGLTLSGGTANGVVYLNASKAATSGTALTFDGTNAGFGVSSPSYRIDAQTTATGTAAGDNTVGYFGSLASGRDANIRFGDSVNASARIGYLSGNLYFYTNGAERGRFDLSGNYGVGTTSPGTYDSGKIGTSHKFLTVATPSSSTYAVGQLAGSQTSAGDRIGYLTFVNTANDANYKYTAWIGTEVEGSTAGQRGARLVLSTMADASGAGPIERLRADSKGNVVVNTAAIATTATDGFLYVPTCAGTPTGTPTTYTGRAPIVVDTTNNKLYFYSGGQWRDAGP